MCVFFFIFIINFTESPQSHTSILNIPFNKQAVLSFYCLIIFVNIWMDT